MSVRPIVIASLVLGALSLARDARAAGPLGVDARVNDPTLDSIDDDTTQSETSLAVHGNTVCGGYNNTRNGIIASSGYGRSADNGTTWTDLDLVGSRHGSDPVMVAHKASGRFYFASNAGLGGPGPTETVRTIIGVATSTDDCQTFSALPTNASPSILPFPANICFPTLGSCSTNQDCAFGSVCTNANQQDKPWMAIDNSGGPGDGNLYVCWGAPDGIHISRSTDAAVSFGDEQIVVPAVTNPAGCSIAVGPSGEVYVSWFSYSAGAVQLLRSFDRGLSWSGVRQVNTDPISPAGTGRAHVCSGALWPTLNGDVRMAQIVAMAVDTTGGPYNGNIYIVWGALPVTPPVDPDGDRSDVWFSRSADSGQTWSEEVQVGSGSSTDQFMPSIAVGGNGAVSLMWFDRRNDPGNLLIDVYRAFSRDGGETIDPIRRVTDVSFPVPPISGQPTSSGNFDPLRRECYMGDYLAVAADDESFYYLWGDNRNTVTSAAYPGGRPDPDVYFDRVSVPPVSAKLTQGGTWTPQQVEGGLLYGLAVAPSSPTTVYAATGNGVFKSIDSGASWTSASTGLTIPRTDAIVVDSANPDHAYVSTLGHGVFETDNGGDSWVSTAGPGNNYIDALAIDPADADTLFASSGNGIYRTVDGGGTWTLVTSIAGPALFYGIDIAPSDSSTIFAGYSLNFAGVGGGVLKSVDGGSTWTPMNNGLSVDPAFTAHSFGFDPADADIVYAGTNTGTYKSTDGGANWSSTYNGLAYVPLVRQFAIDASNPSTVYGAAPGLGVIKTTDAGANWTALTNGFGNLTVDMLGIDPTNANRLYAGTFGGGFYKTLDGGTSWAESNTGLTAVSASALAIDPTDPDVMYAGTWNGGVMKSIDAGVTWSSVNSGLTQNDLSISALAVDPSDPLTVYAGGSGVYKSVTGGAAWVRIDSGFTGALLAIDPDDTSTIYSGADGVFKSDDGGSTWTPSNSGMPVTVVRALAIDPGDTDTLYAGTDDGLFKSTNGGGSWTAANAGLPAAYIYALAVRPGLPSTVYVGLYGSGVYKSTDAGATWSAAGAELAGRSVSTFVLDPHQRDTLYAGTDTGVYKSITAGSTWTALSDGLDFNGTARYVYALAIDPHDSSRLFAGTEGGVSVLGPVACGEAGQPSCANSLAATAECRMDLSPAPTAGFDLTFYPGVSDVFGTAVNLATSVGAIATSDSPYSFDGVRGAWSSMWDTPALDADIGFQFTCPGSGCQSGEPVLVSGTLSNITGSALPGGPTYILDGGVRYSSATDDYSGTCTLNAFLPVNTPAGTDVTVAVRSGGAACGQGVIDIPVEVTFGTVTTAGATLITSACNVPDGIPSNLQLEIGGLVYFFDVSTTAAYAAPITVCFQYPVGLDAVVSGLRLLHQESGSFQDVSTSVDAANRLLCGQVSSLSPFVVGLDAPPDTGFTPPDVAARNCEGKVIKRLGVLGNQIASCWIKAANKAFAGQTFDQAACAATAKAKFDTALAGTTGCPACLLSVQGELRAEVVSAVGSFAGGAYCAGTTPLGGGFGFAPLDVGAKTCGKGLTRQAAKLAKKIAICRFKSAKAAFRGSTFDRAACEAAALAAYSTATATLTGCPPCFAASESALATQAQAFAGSTGTAVYCAGSTALP